MPRVRLRTLMIVVAIAALLFGGVLEAGRRRARFRQLERHYMWEQMDAGFATLLMESFERDPSVGPRKLAAARRLEAYYGRLRAKYERATRYPWLPVPPDPPPP